MVKGLYTAHTGMVNEMKRMDVLANNLANSEPIPGGMTADPPDMDQLTL